MQSMSLLLHLPLGASDCRPPIELVRPPLSVVRTFPMLCFAGARDWRGARDVLALSVLPETGANDLRIEFKYRQFQKSGWNGQIAKCV